MGGNEEGEVLVGLGWAGLGWAGLGWVWREEEAGSGSAGRVSQELAVRFPLVPCPPLHALASPRTCALLLPYISKRGWCVGARRPGLGPLARRDALATGGPLGVAVGHGAY